MSKEYYIYRVIDDDGKKRYELNPKEIDCGTPH